MLEEQNRRELLAKLGVGAAALVTGWTSSAAAQSVNQSCKPARITASRETPISIQTGASGESFTFSVVGTNSGFQITNSTVVPALDPSQLGIADDRRSLRLGVHIGAGAGGIIGLDSILAKGSSGRCHFKGLKDGVVIKF